MRGQSGQIFLATLNSSQPAAAELAEPWLEAKLMQPLRTYLEGALDGPQARRLLALAAIYDGQRVRRPLGSAAVTLQIVRDWAVKFSWPQWPHRSQGAYNMRCFVWLQRRSASA